MWRSFTVVLFFQSKYGCMHTYPHHSLLVAAWRLRRYCPSELRRWCLVMWWTSSSLHQDCAPCIIGYRPRRRRSIASNRRTWSIYVGLIDYMRQEFVSDDDHKVKLPHRIFNKCTYVHNCNHEEFWCWNLFQYAFYEVKEVVFGVKSAPCVLYDGGLDSGKEQAKYLAFFEEKKTISFFSVVRTLLLPGYIQVLRKISFSCTKHSTCSNI